MFAYVEEVEGLPDGVLNQDRLLPVSGITERVWSSFPGRCEYNQAGKAEKKLVALSVMKAWCEAILTRSEKQFLDDLGLPDWISVAKPAALAEASDPRLAIHDQDDDDTLAPAAGAEAGDTDEDQRVDGDDSTTESDNGNDD